MKETHFQVFLFEGGILHWEVDCLSLNQFLKIILGIFFGIKLVLE